MAVKGFKTVNFDDRSIQKFQDNVIAMKSELDKAEFINGIFIEAKIDVTPTSIDHKLQKEPSGWFLMDIQGNATVWRTAWNDKSITLQSSALVTIGLWVF